MSEFLFFFMILFLAFILETLDSSLGQGYGTLGSPILIMLGFDPKVVVPAILISQAIGGLSAAILHHHFHNVNFSTYNTEDFKKVYWIVGCGLMGVCAASILGSVISKDILSGYIGCLVLVIGIFILSGMTISFSWWKFTILGLVSAFNKGLSGGGYGPLIAGGQVVIGVPGKAAIGITDLAELPICLAGFLVWILRGGPFDLSLVIPLCIGACLAPILGAWITYKLTMPNIRVILGSVLVILGILCLAKLLNP